VKRRTTARRGADGGGRHAGARRRWCAVARLAGAVAAWTLAPAAAAPLTGDEIATVCAEAEGGAHCGRLIEKAQLARLPNLAVRDGATLKVSLYPAGVASFTDTEALDGGRSYSLWDYIDRINAVLLYTTDGDKVSFTLLQRANGHRVELPNVPALAPDRQRLATADFCPSRCVNELAVWRVTRDGVRKELAWKPKDAWSDAGVAWKSADALVVEYTRAGDGSAGSVERRLTERDWQHPAPP
jgi:hypothetical protein